MGEHRFEIPASENSSPWDKLSPSAQEVLGNIPTYMAPANELINRDASTQLNMPTAVREWAEQSVNKAVSCWIDIQDDLGIDVPSDLEGLAALASSHLVETRLGDRLERLYHSKNTLSLSSKVGLNDEKLGDSMELVLIPWQAFSNNLEKIEDFTNTLAIFSGHPSLVWAQRLKLVTPNETSIYRDIHDPDRWISARGYLDTMIQRDGPWGIMLTQIGEPGFKAIEGTDAIPNIQPPSIANRFKIDEVSVDYMGIFEALALYIQQGPDNLRSWSAWLPANRLKALMSTGNGLIPYISYDFSGAQAYVKISEDFDNPNHLIQQRLTVL